MNRATFAVTCAAMLAAQIASGQSPATSTPPSNSQSRPDADYPHPSGQDSQPSKTPSNKPPEPTTGKGTAESRGSKTSHQSKQVQNVAKQGAYKGNVGKKGDPGTACSTARSTPNGGLDCGTSGEGATPGKVPK